MLINLLADITAMKVLASAAVDAAAEQARLKYITAGAGQAMVYQAKADEAARFLAATNPGTSATDWPLLSAEIGITGAALTDVAQAIIATRNQWTLLAATIEAKRMGAKKAIDAATNGAQIAVAKAVTWP